MEARDDKKRFHFLLLFALLFPNLNYSSEIANLESKLKYDNSVLRHLLITVDALNSSDSFLTQDTRDSKKLAEERAHEAKLKNETSIKADSNNSDRSYLFKT